MEMKLSAVLLCCCGGNFLLYSSTLDSTTLASQLLPLAGCIPYSSLDSNTHCQLLKFSTTNNIDRSGVEDLHEKKLGGHNLITRSKNLVTVIFCSRHGSLTYRRADSAFTGASSLSHRNERYRCRCGQDCTTPARLY
jgi:hypothetical protein